MPAVQSWLAEQIRVMGHVVGPPQREAVMWPDPRLAWRSVYAQDRLYRLGEVRVVGEGSRGGIAPAMRRTGCNTAIWLEAQTNNAIAAGRANRLTRPCPMRYTANPIANKMAHRCGDPKVPIHVFATRTDTLNSRSAI